MDADLVLLRLARAHRNLVRRPDIARAGVSPAQWQRLVERGEWVPVAPDVWRHALTPETWQLRALAGLMYLGHEAALFGHTSVAWWDLDVPEPSQVEFVVPRGRRHLCNALVVHTTQHWHRCDLYRHSGARVTSRRGRSSTSPAPARRRRSSRMRSTARYERGCSTSTP